MKHNIVFSKLLKSEIDDYKNNCNFTEYGVLPEIECFEERCKGNSIVAISIKHTVAVETVNKVIRSIKAKIYRYMKQYL